LLDQAAVIHNSFFSFRVYNSGKIISQKISSDVSQSPRAFHHHDLRRRIPRARRKGFTRTIELFETAREGKAAAERDAARLRQQLEDREEEFETIRTQIVGLRKEPRRRSRAGGEDAQAIDLLTGNGIRGIIESNDRANHGTRQGKNAVTAKTSPVNPANQPNGNSVKRKNSVRVEIYDQIYNLRGATLIHPEAGRIRGREDA